MAKVSVVVLGDVGHSPRMQYHALSLANEGYSVTLIGYNGSQPLDSLTSHPNVRFKYLANPPDFKEYLSGTFAYILKALWQSVTLFLALLLSGIPSYVLVQNPPAIPSLGICYIFSRLSGAKFIIDWHNYAHTILALSLDENHSLVKLCRVLEFWFGRRSDAGLCVTKGMKEDLQEKHGVKAETLYDRPPEQFQPISVGEKHEFLRKIGEEYELFLKDCDTIETVLTRKNDDGSVELRPDRPALLISSTSWTEDEDFTLLLEALQDYEDAKKAGAELPRLILAITGKGPLKEFYVKIMEARKWIHIKFITPWLTSADYPKLLACGDLGVSLHISSSELDLPMKVVDMFGCGLPVAAVHFKCLPELVRHKRNGVVFESSEDLFKELQEWLKNFPEGMNAGWRKSIGEHLKAFQSLRWDENWKTNALPLFNEV